MSRHHNVHAYEVMHVINDVNNMSQEEAEQIYGIEFYEDGTIFDPTYNQTFISIGDWANFSVEQDEVEYSEGFKTHEEYI